MICGLPVTDVEVAMDPHYTLGEPMKSLLATILLVAISSTATAQETPEQPLSAFSVSTDSLTWVIDGYSVIGTYESRTQPYLRYHVEVFGIKLPESLIDGYEPNTGEGWQRRIDGAIMLSVDYHPFANLHGLHFGGGFNLQRSTVSRGGTETSQFATFEPVVRAGFQWFPFDQGLFLSPYFVLGFPFHLSEPQAIDGEVYEEAAILPVGSVQIGWRFPSRNE